MAANSGNNILIPDKNTILEQTFTEALRINFNSVQKWTNWKEDHEKLKKILKDLPNKLSHPGVISFGSRALVKADIVHTNEILSSVGDGYFVKQSVKQALDMCDRRIKESDKMLKDLEKEHELIRSRQVLPRMEEAFPSGDENDIVEEYDEEKEAEWRVRHREMEKKYRQELAELRKRRQDEGPPQTAEDLFRRLDLLELEEELNDELERLNDEADSDELDEESGEENASEDEVEKKDIQEKDTRNGRMQQSNLSHNKDNLPVFNNAIKSFEGYQKVSKNSPSLEPGQVSYGFTDQKGDQWQKSVLTNYDEDNSAGSSLQKSRKSISFVSDDDDDDDDNDNESCTENDKEVDPIYIRFKHSDCEIQEPPANQTTENGDIILINSPRDIYKQYAHLMPSFKLKSILKKNSSYEGASSTSDYIIPPSQPFGSSVGLTWQDEEDDQNAPQPARDLTHLPPVLRDVLETNPSEPATSQPRPVEPSRPVSRFKASRAAKNR